MRLPCAKTHIKFHSWKACVRMVVAVLVRLVTGAGGRVSRGVVPRDLGRRFLPGPVAVDGGLTGNRPATGGPAGAWATDAIGAREPRRQQTSKEPGDDPAIRVSRPDLPPPGPPQPSLGPPFAPVRAELSAPCRPPGRLPSVRPRLSTGWTRAGRLAVDVAKSAFSEFTLKSRSLSSAS